MALLILSLYGMQGCMIFVYLNKGELYWVVAIVGAPEREVLWVGSARKQMADWCMGNAI